MRTWRARRYSVRINRRHRVVITVRRFRLAHKPNRSGVHTFNVRIGGIRQIVIAHQHSKARKKPLPLRRRLQLAGAALLILFGISGIAYGIGHLNQPQQLAPAQTFKATPSAKVITKPVTLSRSIPTHITIASQNIDVDLISVGLDANNSIELPPALEWVAGWYKYSPTPGELGPAVIVGHVDNYEGTSVFWNLRYVQAGDTIDVARTDGTTAHFRVTQLAEYDQNNFPTKLVYGDTSDAQLRVITCAGTFDPATGNYSQNTVVYATLIP